MPKFILGIDGGGTSCRAAVAAPDGRVLGRGKSGAANILTDPDAALANIEAAARSAFAEAGLAPEAIAEAAAVLGLAGNNVGDAVNYVRTRLPFADAVIESDGLIALQGALGDEDGAIAILGTGTIYLKRLAGKVSYIGGWGFAVGDLGSGARLGQAALQECLLVHDGIHPPSDLAASLLVEFGNDPGQVVEFARLARPGDFGRYAPRVFEYAEKGDAAAVRLLRASAAHVDEVLDLITADGVERISLLGGLAPLYPRWLAARHHGKLVAAAADALTGAVAIAAQRFATAGGR
ncbi:N-acetylglucosamine kinase [Rhizobiaceae bacterium n13]|uniref:N-acetylglucosamine kinase n=1 Tax=Ferirhizobium litorale TaxID=2927786 RepID=A0AAE3QAW6_9HYPH|nr:BadF/BadG/BcrA/BcrD ATPase family protein [Fererhizobium litorale]MDI7862309.1 N-acetylglucosamine kinase [Fererhizobium litorale]MDI7922417.1 N-acetylglucosamine kinase [Fererhizobium litorale]